VRSADDPQMVGASSRDQNSGVIGLGRSRPTFPLPLAKQLQTEFPDGIARIAEIPDARLFVQEEQPDLVCERVNEFLLST
jgi:hypothetical protein